MVIDLIPPVYESTALEVVSSIENYYSAIYQLAVASLPVSRVRGMIDISAQRPEPVHVSSCAWNASGTINSK
jgi:hypothetical protein